MTGEKHRRDRDPFCVKQFHTEWLETRGLTDVYKTPIQLRQAQETALIVIDSGFSLEAMREAGRIIACADLTTGRVCVGKPVLCESEMQQFAGDPLNHGSIVLAGHDGGPGLTQLMPEAPLILIRAFGTENSLIRTQWNDNQIVRPGWTEAYRWAVALCRQQNMSSVANCSFGGFPHAMDGTGWESRQLRMETGPGKPGHVVVSATGPGDGQPLHASWNAMPGETVTVTAQQRHSTRYNFWCAAPPTASLSDFINYAGWKLHVFRDGKRVFQQDAEQVANNLWNQRKQIMLPIEGAGQVQFVLTRELRHADKAMPLLPQRFDCWIESGDAGFLDHVDPVAISEPAVFPHVLAVGLQNGKYGPNPMHPDAKPDVLLPADHRGLAISFRAPAVSVMVAQLFNSGNHHLDVNSVKAVLGKSATGSLSHPWQQHGSKKRSRKSAGHYYS